MSAQAATTPFAKRFAVPEIDAEEEKHKIMAKLEPLLGHVTLFGNRVLVAKWVPEKTGNIIRSPNAQREDKWQSKVGLVIAVGPLAFEDDAQNDFRGLRAKPGDWVLYRYSDGADSDLVPPGTFDKVPAKIVADVEIQGVLARPDLFY